MSSITTIKGRSGFYVRVAVPRPLRKVMGTSQVMRKAGNTRQEALRNQAGIVLDIENLFRDRLKQDPIASTRRLVDPKDPMFMDLLHQAFRDAGVDSDVIHTDEKVSQKLDAVIQGKEPYQTWVQNRSIELQPSQGTLKAWESRLKRLAQWYESDYVGQMTKEQAVKYKNFLLKSLKHSSVKSHIVTLKAFWSWAIDNNELDENIWDRLTRNLKESPKKTAIPIILRAEARELALDANDIRFFIQYYTGCRASEHCGLRYKDIDLENKLISFVEYEQGDVIRHLKGRQKDERVVPIHSHLHELLTKYKLPLKSDSEDPIWFEKGNRWGHNWGARFTRRYGFSSHELRAYVVTQLINQNVSPFILNAITRHTVPGASQVVEGYFRPTLDQLREVVETLE